MYFGVDYYPEHWVYPYAGSADNPEAAWEKDAALMAKVGVNVIRIGEFTWGLCEPEEGKYDFLWLRRVMDIMAVHQIKVILATPTAAPPVWLAQKHPEYPPPRRTRPPQTRRHPPRCLPHQRFLLGLFQTHRHPDGLRPRRPSPTPGLAD